MKVDKDHEKSTLAIVIHCLKLVVWLAMVFYGYHSIISSWFKYHIYFNRLAENTEILNLLRKNPSCIACIQFFYLPEI